MKTLLNVLNQFLLIENANKIILTDDRNKISCYSGEFELMVSRSFELGNNNLPKQTIRVYYGGAPVWGQDSEFLTEDEVKEFNSKFYKVNEHLFRVIDNSKKTANKDFQRLVVTEPKKA